MESKSGNFGQDFLKAVLLSTFGKEPTSELLARASIEQNDTGLQLKIKPTRAGTIPPHLPGLAAGQDKKPA